MLRINSSLHLRGCLPCVWNWQDENIWRFMHGYRTARKNQKSTSQEEERMPSVPHRRKSVVFAGFSVRSLPRRGMKAQCSHTVWGEHSEGDSLPWLCLFSSLPSPPVCCDEWFWYQLCVCVGVWVCAHARVWRMTVFVPDRPAGL